MSFAELQAATYKRAKEEIKIEITLEDDSKKVLTFHANYIGYLQQVEVESLRATGQDWVSKFVASSITDENGRKMTVSQAEQLSPEHAEIFLNAVLRVNPLTSPKEVDENGNEIKKK